jgi:hypothetical protein
MVRIYAVKFITITTINIIIKNITIAINITININITITINITIAINITITINITIQLLPEYHHHRHQYHQLLIKKTSLPLILFCQMVLY